MSLSAPTGARLINGVGGVGLGLGLGLGQQKWVLQQHQSHAHEEVGKAGNIHAAGGVHMVFPVDGHSSSLKRKREMAGFEIGGPPPPTWNPGGRPCRVIYHY